MAIIRSAPSSGERSEFLKAYFAITPTVASVVRHVSLSSQIFSGTEFHVATFCAEHGLRLALS